MKQTKTAGTIRDSVPYYDIERKRKPVPKIVDAYADFVGAMRKAIGPTKRK